MSGFEVREGGIDFDDGTDIRWKDVRSFYKKRSRLFGPVNILSTPRFDYTKGREFLVSAHPG